MTRWRFLQAGGALAALALLGFGACVLNLPPGDRTVAAPPLPRAETEAMLAELAPPRSERPLIAIIGLNDATETTDYLVPAGILRRADVADVVLLATGDAPVQLYPALRVQPDATIAGFDAAHPDGADYVIVPAMSRDDAPAVLGWLREQSDKGAMIIGVCAGAKVVAAAGLLDGKRATTHRYSRDDLRRLGPTTTLVADRRLVADRGVVTTTGITASMPMMLALIEAIGGRARANAAAAGLGVARWDARHASEAFRLTRPFATTVLSNRLVFWRRETLGIELRPGMDEVALALVADAWSRTYRSRAVSFAPSASTVTTAHSIRILPDRIATGWPSARRIPVDPDLPPAEALDRTLAAISGRYAERTAVVAMQTGIPLGE
ncbi:DJ-1/PfpI family protein [Paracoccus sp. S-4012]|uniref:DJ-1/PfpI family protein n=1 Tax=Paracoccus sp. S-4012 TaxID=2665648 RepID=UPI0018A23DDA|nr:DJ-1/PfpI family protein [Paracoccus sp. S-4012]